MAKPRILIVEDNPDNLELVSFLIQRAGFEALQASNGVQGVAVARQYKPDLVLLDLAMPDMDGWTMARTLKSDPATKSIPLVALTAFSLPGDRRRALEAGCDGYLTKPIHVATFIKEISAYIRSGEQP